MTSLRSPGGLNHLPNNINTHPHLARHNRSHSAHGKIHKHKRSSSSSSAILSPLSTHSVDSSFNFTYNRASHDEPWSAVSTTTTAAFTPVDYTPSSQQQPQAPFKIKPYLKKFSLKDSSTTHAIDLSRPAAENQGLANLGLSDAAYTTGGGPTSGLGAGANRHHRSTSNTSQFSASSSMHRPSIPYVHPMRQTPRPYTPPTQSYANSLIGSDHSQGEEAMPDTEEIPSRHHFYENPYKRSGSVASVPITAAGPPVLRIHTSSTGLPSQSQTSLPTTSPIGSRPRGDTGKSFDTVVSPSSRTSFDKAFGFIRGRDSPVDPASRAASIRAARLAYREKEEAKERRAEKEALKQHDREQRKRERHEERVRNKSDSSGSATNRTLTNEKIETPVAGKEYSLYTPAHSRSLPALVDIADTPQRSHSTPMPSSRRAAKSRWLAFVTWFRTRLLRFGRRLGKTS